MARRKAVSPIVSTIVLILIAMSMALGAYTFILQGQESVTGKTERVELETINSSCLPGRVTWWVNNTGKRSVESSKADLFVYGANGLNSTLSETGLPVEGFTRAFGHGMIEVVPNKGMELGESYSLEMEVGDAEITSSCRVGGEWWDSDWDYRRALHIDEPGSKVTARVKVDATEPISVRKMVDDGKLRQDCADVRIVNHGEVAFYDIRRCDPDNRLRIRTNLTDPELGTVYMYYGNLQAGYANITVSEGIDPGLNNPKLGPEERINLP